MTIKNDNKEDAAQYLINKCGSYLLYLNTKEIDRSIEDFKKKHGDIKK